MDPEAAVLPAAGVPVASVPRSLPATQLLSPRDRDSVCREPADIQPVDFVSAGLDQQSVGRARAGTVEHDLRPERVRIAGECRLGAAVDDDAGVRDCSGRGEPMPAGSRRRRGRVATGQARIIVNEVRVAGRDLKEDGDRAGARGIGIQDRLSQGNLARCRGCSSPGCSRAGAPVEMIETRQQANQDSTPPACPAERSPQCPAFRIWTPGPDRA